MKDHFQYILPLAINIIRYFLFAGIPFLIFYIKFPQFFMKNKIQSRFAKRKDFIREILHSTQTTFILAGVGLLMMKTPLFEYTQVYKNISDLPLAWIPLSLILALILHDTYFYWMHRLIHHPKLFKHIHLTHHKSVNPSPWTSYSFHFLEALLESLVAPLILFLIPMHPIALLLFAFSSFLINVYGHLGYEIAPRWLRHSLFFEILNTSTHHNYHHEKFNGNYGLYFRVWDRIMKTEHPDYVKQYDQIQERRFNDVKTSKSPWQTGFLVLLVLGIGLFNLRAKSDGSIEGKWKDEKTGGIISIYEEEGLYFGRLLGSDKAEDDKKIKEKGPIYILKNFKKESETKYCCGSIFQPLEKRTVSGTLILEEENMLKINGKYAGFTGSRIWKRI